MSSSPWHPDLRTDDPQPVIELMKANRDKIASQFGAKRWHTDEWYKGKPMKKGGYLEKMEL